MVQYSNVNIRAVQVVLTEVLGEQGFRAVERMYELVNEAEHVGEIEGHARGVQHGWGAGFDRGYDEGYVDGRDDADYDSSNTVDEDSFYAGWHYGYAAGEQNAALTHAAFYGTGVIQLTDQSAEREFDARAAAYDHDEALLDEDFDEIDDLSLVDRRAIGYTD